jgi:hypothetical protein
MSKCQFCNGKGFKGKKICEECTTPKRMIIAIDKAIRINKKLKKYGQVKKLQSIRRLLPDNPVLAIAQAEDNNMSKLFIEMLQKAFGILPFR